MEYYFQNITVQNTNKKPHIATLIIITVPARKAATMLVALTPHTAVVIITLKVKRSFTILDLKLILSRQLHT